MFNDVILLHGEYINELIAARPCFYAGEEKKRQERRNMRVELLFKLVQKNNEIVNVLVMEYCFKENT